MPSKTPLPTNFKLPPYRLPCLSPTPLPFRKPHSARKSTRRIRIFPYYHRLPTTATTCARFRLARKKPSTTICITSESERLRTYIHAFLTRANTHASTLHASLTSLRTQIIGYAWQSHQLATGHFPLSAALTHTFQPHSLAPDR